MEEHVTVSLANNTSVNAPLTLMATTAISVCSNNITAKYAGSLFWRARVINALLMICTDINPCDYNPCLNGGTCNRLSYDDYSCQCTVDYNGENCDHCEYFTRVPVNAIAELNAPPPVLLK